MMPIVVIGIVLCLLGGCSDADTSHGNKVLIQVEDVVATVSDFTQAFEILKADSLIDDADDNSALAEARLALLNQMTEEILLTVRARELDIQISDAELEAAVADIKADYPEGEFEGVLLEYAVPYRFWLKRLKLRLLMDKVIAHELEGQVAITPEDIAAYYRDHYAGQDQEARAEQENDDLEASIVQQLRREKTEAAYGAWIQRLKESHPIDINEQEWERLVSS
jgi:hypothetical protein